jgi:hypothetical protein
MIAVLFFDATKSAHAQPESLYNFTTYLQQVQLHQVLPYKFRTDDGESYREDAYDTKNLTTRTYVFGEKEWHLKAAVVQVDFLLAEKSGKEFLLTDYKFSPGGDPDNMDADCFIYTLRHTTKGYQVTKIYVFYDEPCLVWEFVVPETGNVLNENAAIFPEYVEGGLGRLYIVELYPTTAPVYDEHTKLLPSQLVIPQ